MLLSNTHKNVCYLCKPVHFFICSFVHLDIRHSNLQSLSHSFSLCQSINQSQNKSVPTFSVICQSWISVHVAQSCEENVQRISYFIYQTKKRHLLRVSVEMLQYLTVCLSSSEDLICAWSMSLWISISWRRCFMACSFNAIKYCSFSVVYFERKESPIA